jgi:hypothetical protein
MDVYMQSQQSDEQYFLCAPNNVAVEISAWCGGGPLRETEISIDGTPAGAAPVYPWIYTGGIDPFLWAPIPGVQTLEFKPFRVELTPFAALLANGKPHTVVLSVDDANDYFQGFATLFAYQDRYAKRVTGALTKDTLVANPAPTITENLSGTAPSIDGTIVVTSTRNYELDGYVNTSHGRKTTKINSTLVFANEQTYSDESATTGTTVTKQTTYDATTEVTHDGWLGFELHRKVVSFPISTSIGFFLDAAGTGTQISAIDQKYTQEALDVGNARNFASYSSNEVNSSDTLDILDDEYITGNSNQSSGQTYIAFDTNGACYAQSVSAKNNLVSAVQNSPCNPADARQYLAPLFAR